MMEMKSEREQCALVEKGQSIVDHQVRLVVNSLRLLILMCILFSCSEVLL